MDAYGKQRFQESIQPLLSQYCYDCHGHAAAEGGVALEQAETSDAVLGNPELWHRVLKQLRAGLMPPEGLKPTDEEVSRLEEWIKQSAFGIDPDDPDPGRVTLRRLNRVEYRNTIRDLLGVDFDADGFFPPDDTGRGFDNNGDVLSLSPLLLEKYLQAAAAIIGQAIPLSVNPSNEFARYFPQVVPVNEQARSKYARELLDDFASRAFRRPVDAETLDRLVALAEQTVVAPGQTFEGGIARAMVAVLASPRFLFREETALPPDASRRYPLVDEFSLASRLSYFLWSSMPDDELLELAARGELRAHLDAQVHRMLSDDKSEAFTSNFVGQWLQVRDIETVLINSFVIIQRDRMADPFAAASRLRFRELNRKYSEDLTEGEREELEIVRRAFLATYRSSRQFELNDQIRAAMRRETELTFEYVMRHNRPLTELLDGNYTFLNADLANFYAIEGLVGLGDDMQRRELPAESHRGGVLTQGSILAVTSNPDRTSPVKRGRFILDNVLGMPPPPALPNVPPLEESEARLGGKTPSLRELLLLHREDPLCSSCHARMDPLGLALENFNALGMWRDFDRGNPIDSSGELITGEKFSGIDELKRVLVDEHAEEFYRCLTERMFCYALGRELDYRDVAFVDSIVEQIIADGGRPATLVQGIIHSPAFQRRRPLATDVEDVDGADPAPSAQTEKADP